MKSMIAAAVGLAIVSSASPVFAQGCPERLTDEWVAGLGPVVATREDLRVYRPESMRILGADVVYVVVEPPGRSDPEVKFRLDARVGRSGELPRSLIRAFASTYPDDEGCEEAPTFSCSAYREDRNGEGYRLGDIDLGAIGQGFSEFGGPWRGAQAELMRREQESADLLMLTCAYAVR